MLELNNFGPRRSSGMHYGMRGLGEAADETPEVRTLPWDIGKESAPTRVEVREERWERAALYLGVIGALTGLLISLPEIIRMVKKRRR
jgi:hypothetical protein